MLDIIKILRGIIILNLEPENITEIYINENLTEIKFEQLTDFITYSKEKKRIIYPSSKIDEFVNSKNKIILNIYEALNTLGLKKLLLKKDDNKNKEIILYGFLHKNPFNSNVDHYLETLEDPDYMKNNEIKDNNIDNIINENNNIINNMKKKKIKKKIK